MARNVGSIEVTLDLDSAGAILQAIADGKLIGKALGDGVENELDGRDFLGGKDRERDAKRNGEKQGDEYNKGFRKSMDKNASKNRGRLQRELIKWGAIIASFGETVGVALFGAAGAIVSLASSLLAAASASALLIPVALGLGQALGVVVIGAQGMGTAFGAVNEEMALAIEEGREFNIEAENIAAAMGLLTPAAQGVVRVFAEWRTELGDIQALIQEDLFAGLAEPLDALIKDQLPGVTAALQETATAINGFFKEFIEGLGTFDFGDIMSDLVPIIDNVLGAITPLTTAFLDFVIIATPFAELLTERFLEWAQSLAEFTSSSEGLEAISDFLQRALDSLESWLELIGVTGRIVGNILRIASKEGDALIDSLTEVLTTFNDWIETAEGETAVTEFLESSSRILKALGPLLAGAVGLFDKLVTPGAIDRFEDLAETLGEILPFIGSLLELIGRTKLLNNFAKFLEVIADALEPLLPVFQELADLIGETLADVIDEMVSSGTLDALAEAIGVIAEAAIEFITILAESGQIEVWAEMMAELAMVMADLLTALLPLVEPLANIVLTINALGTIFLGDSIEALSAFVAVLGTVIEKGIEFGEWIEDVFLKNMEDLSNAWETTTEDIARFYNDNVAPIVEAIGGWVESIIAFFDTLQSSVVNAWNTTWRDVISFWDNNVMPILRRIGGFVDTIVRFFGRLKDDVTSAWNDTWQDVIDFWNNNVSPLPGIIAGWVDEIVGFFVALPGRIVEGLSGLKDLIVAPFQEAKDIIDGIVNAISNLATRAIDAAKSIPVIGGLAERLFASGGIVMGATRAVIGEAGAEAVVPLQRPLSQIDPSVRGMAALIRGQGKPTSGGGSASTDNRRSQTNNFTINDMTGDGDATAQKVVNRLAVSL